MSKLNVTILIVCFSLLGVFFIREAYSERSKRIELETELAGCIYSKKTFYRRLTAQELIYRDTVTINDTILAVPPKDSSLWNVTWDSSVVNAADFGIIVLRGATIDKIEASMNSLPDGSRRTIYLGSPIDWLNAARKRRADSSEVTE